MKTIASKQSRTAETSAQPLTRRADQIKAHQSDPSSSTSGPHHYTIVFVPRATEVCRRVLEEEGVSGDVDIAEVSGVCEVAQGRWLRLVDSTNSNSFRSRMTSSAWSWRVRPERFSS